MMNLLEKVTIRHYHKHRIGEFDRGTVEALGYRSAQSQTRRFEVLAEVADLNGRTVLDVGCGYGDLKGYLDDRFHGFNYVGIDQMAEFIVEARSLYGQRPSCYFCIADFTEAELPPADYVFASGVLNYRCEDPGFHRAMIEKMYRAAAQVFAFNMLDAAVFPAHPLLIGHDMDEIMKYCESLCLHTERVQGYLEDDFTVVMRKT